MKPLSACDMNAVLGTAFIGRNVYYLDSVGSTQDSAKSFALSGAAEGTVVIAAQQTAGKGKRGAEWASPPGGLWLSVILYPEGGLNPAVLTLAGAVAAAGAIERAAGLKTSVRWPNDCYVNGRKAAGVIGEKSGRAVIIGIGVNLNVSMDDLPAGLRRTAASISVEKGHQIDENEFLRELLKEFESMYCAASGGDALPVISRLEKMYGIAGRSVCGFSGGRKVEGTVSGFSEDGSIIIRLDSGLQVSFASGEFTLEKEKIS